MDKKISLEFSVDNFEFEDVKDSRFAKGLIHAFADGKNAHTHPIDREVLINCANSVYDIPIVCRYNGFTDDFMSHEPDETPIGFVKETSPTYSNPIIFEKVPDGRTFLVIKALIWKKYAKDAVRVLKNSNGNKSVSVEITITKGEEIDGRIRVDEFVLDGITILGDFVTPAVKDARIYVEFAKDKKEYLDDIKFAENKKEVGEQDMENEKDMANNSDISCSSCNTENMEDNTVCAACGDNMANSCGDMSDTVNCECNPTGDMADAKCAEGCSDDYACNTNMESQDDVSMEGNPGHGDMRDGPGEDGMRREDCNPDCENYACDTSKSMSIEMAMEEIKKMSDRINELEAQNKAYMAKIECMSDYDSLKQYREENEKRIKMEADMATMNTVMADIISRGYSMSDDEKNCFISKFSEFNSVDAWSNYVKAQVFDNCNNNSKVQQIGLPFADIKKPDSIWDSI